MEGPAVADYPAGARMRPRVIDDFEFVWMLRGEALFATGSEAHVLTPGHLLLVPPGLRHSFAWDQRRASRHGYVHFQPDPEDRPESGAPRQRRMTEHDPLSGLCAHLIWLGREQPDGWIQQVERTLRFMLPLFTSGSLPGENEPEAMPGPLAAVIDHLRWEWSRMPLRPVGVDELASVGRVSRSYLSRLFQAEFGVSPAAGTERLRCSRAETLLLRTDMTVGAVARQCGFADLYHFSHRFAQRYGLPPSAYRDARSPSDSVLEHPGTRRLAHAVWG
jgi:AraC family transcriptional regulator